MRSVLELLDQPFSFWQLRLLTEDQFCRAAKDRGVVLFPREVEGFHRLRLLNPLLRVRRDGRMIAAMARRGDPHVWEAAGWYSTRRADLLEVRNVGRLSDPAMEPFMARRRLDRTVGDVAYRSSAYLYSHHQLLALPILRAALPHLRYGPNGEVVGFNDIHPVNVGYWRQQADRLRSLVVALSALEPIYYPPIIRRIRYNGDELEHYERWRRDLEAGAMLEWLGVDAAWIRKSARDLLSQADGIDPLGRWVDLVRESDPARWEWLEGEARSALDLRIGAEIFLSYYDKLVDGGLAASIEEPPPRTGGEFSGRLKPRGGLDQTLTEFGLSPHPHLVLLVEGDTELLLFPYVLEHFGIRRDRDFIAVENAQGVGRDISALIAYAVAPLTERNKESRYLRLLRPPTRLLAIMDPEGKFATEEGRQKRREVWIDRILATLPSEHRTLAVRESVEVLVTVETWESKGQSFEFANFTDRQLAVASAQVDSSGQFSIDKRIEIAKSIRASRGSLEPLLGGASKVELAEALWPTLKRKIELAERRQTAHRIPIVRVVDRASALARELPRRNLVIPLRGLPSDELTFCKQFRLASACGIGVQMLLRGRPTRSAPLAQPDVRKCAKRHVR